MNKKQLKRSIVTLNAGLHVREATEGNESSRVIEGRSILFNTPSVVFYEDDQRVIREMIAPEAITRELLDSCDIKMTMFHDRQLILARSNKGKGTLSYDVDAEGVPFAFEAPNTVDGDKALELVRRGDLAGCSFSFSTFYDDVAFVERSVEKKDGKTEITYIVKKVVEVFDFTIAADPAYPETSVEAREFIQEIQELETAPEDPGKSRNEEKIKEQLREMRRAANNKIFV